MTTGTDYQIKIVSNGFEHYRQSVRSNSIPTTLHAAECDARVGWRLNFIFLNNEFCFLAVGKFVV